MREVVETVYITEDGARFESKDKAMRHEEKVLGKHFKSEKELIQFLKNTDIWTIWKISADFKDEPIIDCYKAIASLVSELLASYPLIFVENEKIGIGLYDIIWDNLKEEAIIEHFKKYSEVDISDDKIIELFEFATASNYRDDGILETVGVFVNYIEAINLVFDK